MDTIYVVFAFNEENTSRRCKIKRYCKCCLNVPGNVLFTFSPDLFVCSCSVCILSVGATVALFEAAGATAAAGCV